MEIWNGLTPRRPDLSTTRVTSHEDYLVIVKQIQELQEYGLNLANNMQVMPNLEDTLQDAKKQIDEIQLLAASVSLPEDVKDRLGSLEQQLVAIDQRAINLQLRRDLEFLKEKVARNQIEVLNLQSSFETEVKGFQNKVWGLLNSLQKDTGEKLEVLAEKVRHIDAQVDVQTSLEKFNQLRAR